MIKAIIHAAAIFLHRRKHSSFVNEIYIKYSNAREYTRHELEYPEFLTNNVYHILGAILF